MIWDVNDGEDGIDALSPWLHNIQVGREGGRAGGRGREREGGREGGRERERVGRNIVYCMPIGPGPRLSCDYRGYPCGHIERRGHRQGEEKTGATELPQGTDLLAASHDIITNHL